jgi:hypothetical protein
MIFKSFKYYIIILVLSFLSVSSFSQLLSDYKYGYPLKGNFEVSSNFGQIRPNHFHAGIDVRTTKIGIPIIAVSDGYISRIRISKAGYGNVLYITHTDGRMSVYAHLDKFITEIEKYAINKQFEAKEFELTDYPDSTLFPVLKGQIIAWSGNSGRSFGPHLHFEIRNAQNDLPYNPELFGFKASDDIAPEIKNLYLYPLESNSSVNNSSSVFSQKIFYRNGKYYLKNSIEVSGDIGLGVFAFDKINTSKNPQAIYKMKVFKDDSLIFQYINNEISFEESSQINSFIDFENYTKFRDKIIKCYVEPGNTLGIYKNLINRGVMRFYDNELHKIKIVMQDFSKNSTTFSFEVKSVKPKLKKQEKIVDLLKYDIENYIVYENFRAIIPINSLFKNYQKQFYEYSSIYYDSDVYILQNEFIPLKSEISVAVKTNKPVDIEKTLIVNISQNKISPLETYYFDNFFVAKSKKFGSYALMQDTIPPLIKSLTIPENTDLTNINEINFTISDEFSGLKNYYAELDGNFILLQYDYNTNLLKYSFDKNIAQNINHTLIITATDKKNNKAVFNTVFFK